MKQFEVLHVLNGDALKDRFPTQLTGELAVMRECLIEGPVEGKTPSKFYADRATYLYNTYGIPKQDYFEKTIPELQKLLQSDKLTEVNLWFEDDLFCQTNQWYVAHTFLSNRLVERLWVVRPPVQDQYGFGKFDTHGLFNLFKNRILVRHPERLAKLWTLYQANEYEAMMTLVTDTDSNLAFIAPAIEALQEMKKTDETKGRPIIKLLEIMKELNTFEFESVFREFNRRESIYGLGDIQVKRLYEIAICQMNSDKSS